MDTPHHVRAISQLANARTLDAPFTSSPRRWRFTQAAVFALSAGIATLYAYRAPAADPATQVGTLAAEGVVTQRGTQQPVGNVTVVLDGAVTTKTDANGRFRFGGLTAGAHAVRVTGDGFTPMQSEVVVQEGGSQLSLAVQPKDQIPAGQVAADLEIVVKSKK